MKYVLAVVMLMMVSMTALADDKQKESKDKTQTEINHCRNKLSKADLNGDNLSWEETVDLLDDFSGDSFIGGRCDKLMFDMKDSKIMARWVGRMNDFYEGSNWEFKIEAPFEIKDQMEISDINFDGLANAVKFTGGFHYMKRKSDDGDDLSFFRYGFDTSFALEHFDYINGTDINNIFSESQTHKSIRAYGAYYNDGKNKSVIGLGYKLEQSYKAGEQKNICVNTGLNVSQCANVIIGAPIEDTKHFAVIDYRKTFYKQGVNLGVKVMHDIENSITKIDMPVYRMREKDEIGLGGVNISWDSLTREWRATLMVGSTIENFGSLFNNK